VKCGSGLCSVRCCFGRVLQSLVVNNGDVRHEPCEPSLGAEFFRAKALPDPRVGADVGGIYGRRFPSWRQHRGLFLLMMAWSLRVKTLASVSRSGRRRRQRRIPLAGVALESLLWRLHVASSALGLVDVGAAAPDGGRASRRRPRDTWWAVAS
jgi:hypothetical protein